MTLVAPYFVGCGFALYLNRRCKLIKDRDKARVGLEEELRIKRIQRNPPEENRIC